MGNNFTANYYCIYLCDESKRLLKDLFFENIDKNWKWIGDHVTIVTKNNFHKYPELINYCKKNLNLDYDIKIKEIGTSEYCVAVSVETEAPSQNKIKHITLAVSPNGKPYLSNFITQWKKINENILLNGKLTQIF